MNITDIVLILEHLLGNSNLEGYAYNNADWNSDGNLNITDAVNIVQIILGDNLSKGESPS